MANALRGISPLILLITATILEVSGDAVVRIGIYSHAGLPRAGLLAAGGLLLLGYGSFLNLAPVEFGRVVGLYIATLFVVWQVINFVVFRTVPSLPIVLGGALIVAGGLLVTYWKPAG
jgi:small multidrug resistance family-3 protein